MIIMNIKRIVFFLIFFSLPSFAGDILSTAPSNADKDSKYIFYLHGSAEESEGPTDKYEATVEAISDSDAIVISEVRGPANPDTYSNLIIKQIEMLLNSGVPAEHITISGFSKGAIISLAVASKLKNKSINYVFLAGCSAALNDKYGVDASKASGRILSIYDSDDSKFGSCDGILNESDNLSFEEEELNSGKGHKVFRIPKDKFIELWRDPLVDWADA
jgi:hypothetical protein